MDKHNKTFRLEASLVAAIRGKLRTNLLCLFFSIFRIQQTVDWTVFKFITIYNTHTSVFKELKIHGKV